MKGINTYILLFMLCNVVNLYEEEKVMRIKNKFTKILSLFLVITMVFSLCVSIHAGDSLNVKALEGENDSTTNYVANIGGTEYPTLEEAVEKVQSGETIKLMSNIELVDVIRFKTNFISNFQLSA